MRGRGRRNGGHGNGFRGYQGFPVMGPPPAPPQHAQSRSPFFDYTMVKDTFNGCNNTTDAVFEKEVMDRATSLTHTGEAKKKIQDFTAKVVAALEEEKSENTVPDVKIERIGSVGSFIFDTALKTTNKSDIVVQLSSLPSFETVSALGEKVVELIKPTSPNEFSNMVPHDYGCCIMTPNAQVRILVTIVPENNTKLEPDLHLNERVMMINFFSIRHVKWFESVAANLDAEFMAEYRALIRVLKDVKNRFDGFKAISPWALQYIAYFCLSNGPARKKVNLGTAFRRFFEVIAAGMLLPTSNGMIDPTSMSYNIGWDLSLKQMDEICGAAQTCVRIFATGSDGYRAILGTHPATANVDLTQTRSIWNGITVNPSLPMFVEGCMDPYVIDESPSPLVEPPKKIFKTEPVAV